ncbi:MAG TPA: hypothetical protein VFE42_30595 [Chloroflexota bacterium]|nr:hypothetical protein [Chloroflexota bacterium]
MTLLERDILAVVLSLNTVFMILILPNIVPIAYDLGQPTVYLTTLAWGLPLGAIGVWLNHRAHRAERGKKG